MQLSRIDVRGKTYDVPSLLTELDPASLTGVSVALLPPRTSPTAATVWTTVTFVAPTATVLFAGSDADSTGAVVVTGSADLWIKAVAGVETETVRVERITLIGEGQPVVALPNTAVVSVNGKSGTVTLTASDVGADAAGAATAAQAAAATDATSKANSAKSYAAGIAAGMALVFGG
ncbi:MAG: hypothetical protein JWO98_4752 [Frankiales bacterium]|nr:hypothetical protein [Frankiales bacterium]